MMKKLTKSMFLLVTLVFLLLSSGCALAQACAKTANTAVAQQMSKRRGAKISRPAVPELQAGYNLVSLPTYDGSGQLTHPKLLYFPNKWNGWKYWLSFTPYPDGNDDYENPSLVVSDDMVHWQEPDARENPVSGIPSDVGYGGHYSDSHIVMRNNVMELWYRYNKGNRETNRPDYSIDYYYRKTSFDGIHWTQPELMQSSKGGILSLDVNYSDGEYEFWYTDYKHRLLHAVSKDGSAWSSPKVCSLSLGKNYAPWHQDIIQYHGEYYLLQTGVNLTKYSFALFLSRSADGIHFSKGVPFYPSDDPVILSQAWLYRSTLVEEDNRFVFLIAARFPDGRWYLMKSGLSVAEFDQAQGQEFIIEPRSPQVKAL
ncbi:hypothetical protein [Caproicibacter sp.]|uniref:hypothetical protein n=1 Tax=Caproicibacter sp. TaxID=2814884 RepID=UPI0039891EAF